MPRGIRSNHGINHGTQGKLICVGGNGYAECRRSVLWMVGTKPFCNRCFDAWCEEHWDEFEPETITRLSDDEHDFEKNLKDPICQVPKPKVNGSGAHVAHTGGEA